MTADHIIEKIREALEGDHERLCQGREYTCTCGHDDAVQQALTAALQSADEPSAHQNHVLPSTHLAEARAIIGYLLDRHHIAPCLPVESVGVMQRFLASALAATAREDGR